MHDLIMYSSQSFAGAIRSLRRSKVTPMSPILSLLRTTRSGWVIPLLLVITSVPVYSFETVPHPLDTFLDNILDFHEPTGIRGKLRYIEVDAQIVWLDWEQRSDDRPLFTTSWKLVPGEPTLAVHPTNTLQFEELRKFQKGTALELIIKDDGEGHRHILSFRDLSIPPKVPL